MDLPAPVSPVKATKPVGSSSSTRSTTAKLATFRRLSMSELSPLELAPQDLEERAPGRKEEPQRGLGAPHADLVADLELAARTAVERHEHARRLLAARGQADGQRQ